MIHTVKQLKDKVKNLSGGKSDVAQTLIRTYIMERFLERVSISDYRGNFILKGGRCGVHKEDVLFRIN